MRSLRLQGDWSAQIGSCWLGVILKPLRVIQSWILSDRGLHLRHFFTHQRPRPIQEVEFLPYAHHI